MSIGRNARWVVAMVVHLVTFRSLFESQPDHLRATLSKLLTYCLIRPTQPPTLSGTGNK